MELGKGSLKAGARYFGNNTQRVIHWGCSNVANKILVVEEERELRGFYQTELEEDGYRVNTAPGGREALSRLSDESFDLVVLDLELSDVDGLGCLQSIVDLNQNVKVVLTADDATCKQDFHTWLADAFLVKSPDLCELKKTIDTLLHSKGH